jgi:hypothetical protein
MRSKKRAVRFLLGLGGLLIGLLICEIGLRVGGFSQPRFFSMPDRYRGVALRPNAEGWWREEGNAYLRINSAGLRDREHAKQKPPNTFRIAVLGDSFAEARQVPIEDTFWAILEKKLQACPAVTGRQVEVINFGVAGYGTAQELITLRREVWDYSPDLILLLVTPGNDIRDNSRALSLDGARPFFVYRGDQLVLDDSMLETRNSSLAYRLRESRAGQAFEWLGSHSRVLQLLNKARTSYEDRRILSRRKDIASRTKSGPPNSLMDELGLDAMVFYEPTDPAWQDAWRVTEGTITLMRDEATSRGAKFFVVTVSSGKQVIPDPTARFNLLQDAGLKDFFYAEGRIKALGERESLPVLNLAPPFQSYAEQHQVFLHGFGATLGKGHWNQEGHRLAGEIISGWLCDGITQKNQL